MLLTETIAPVTSKTPARARECWFWAGWEPDRYYKRIGARTTPFFGNGDWIREWRTKVESASTLRSVKDAAGGAILITRFYKGFGMSVEGKDWGTLKKFVSLSHAEGHKVWGYLQGQSIFGEFLFNERPDAVEWVARAYDGSQRHWGGAYNRFAPCLTNQAYLEMVESLIEEGLLEVGLDGFHMDNNYYGHCYCASCKHLFREWLEARGDLEQLTGIERADFIEPPPISHEAEIIPDPLMILWIQFGVDQRIKFMKAIRRKIKQTKPEATLTGNPAFLRSYASRLTHGYDPSLEHVAFDSVCIEDGNRPRYSEGILYTQADKQLMAEAGSLRTWATSWAPQKRAGAAGYQAPQDAQSLWAGLAEEFSFGHAYMGNNWALRPTGDGAKLLKETLPVQWEEFEKAAEYFRKLEGELGSSRRQWGELVVYLDTRSLSLCPASDCQVLRAVLNQLMLAGISFKIAFQDQSLPKETRTILMIGQRCVKTSEFERLIDFVANPGRQLFLLGECGTYDEWFVPRGAGNRHRLLNRPNVQVIPLNLHQWVEGKAGGKKYLQGAPAVLSEEGVAKLTPVLRGVAERQGVQLIVPKGILTNIEITAERELLIHLRDLREDHTEVEAGDVKIAIRLEIDEVQMWSPGWLGLESESVYGTGTSEITLPKFRHYACVRLSFTNKQAAI